MSDPYDLERFVRAQDQDNAYKRAVEELQRARKVTHWMWFVFPQIAGLGHSIMAQQYAITSLLEARAYLAHELLGPRLLECSEIVAVGEWRSAMEIFGTLDGQKLRSSMTLFLRAAPERALFSQVLDRYFEGLPDPLTVALLSSNPTR